jgi:putative copper export protein
VVADRWQPVATARDSARTLISFLRGFGDLAIFAVIVLLPVGVIIAVVVYLSRLLWRRLRRRTD